MTREVPRPGEIAVKARFENDRGSFPHNGESDSARRKIRVCLSLEEMSKLHFIRVLINTEKKFLDPLPIRGSRPITLRSFEILACL